jgi:UDP-N-acetylglucosamine 2-epimerase (non-hydrolysing)
MLYSVCDRGYLCTLFVCNKGDTMITVLAIIGTRPEAIKMAPVVRALRARSEAIRTIVCVTGQHRQMLAQVLDIFNIVPDVDLKLMQVNQTLGSLTANLFESLGARIRQDRPDWILGQGDTTSVMVAALCAFYEKIRFGHVEAGLRTYNLAHPFPEEMNRRVADIVTSLYFAPTERNRRALLEERCPAERILITGNTVIDALQWAITAPYVWETGPLATIPQTARIVTITAHRRESFGGPFRDICQAIRELALRHHDAGVHFVYPVHLNPQVQQPVREMLSDLNNVHLLEPLDYLSLVNLMKHSEIILTDSGGIQEEAPSLKVPVLVMREVSERPEAIEAGAVALVGTDTERIIAETSRLLDDPVARNRMQLDVNPYGDGKASERIVQALLDDETQPIVT